FSLHLRRTFVIHSFCPIIGLQFLIKLCQPISVHDRIIVARFHPDKPGQVLVFEKQIETDEFMLD
ncbi:hypothetical protein, partial [Cyclobacterium sediminis]